MVLRTAEFHSRLIEISVIEHSVLSIKVNWGSPKKFSAYQVCISHWIERLLAVERLSFPKLVLSDSVIVVIREQVVSQVNNWSSIFAIFCTLKFLTEILEEYFHSHLYYPIIYSWRVHAKSFMSIK